jgi:heme transport system permease protein
VIAAALRRFAAPPKVPGRMAPALALGVLIAALLLSALLAVGHGAFEISPREVMLILAHQLGLLPAEGYDAQAEAVLLTIRLPRVVLGILTGAGLAVSGAAMQGLFRNPLADPTLIGVSSGAALGAATIIVVGAMLLPGLTREWGGLLLPLAAFLGGLAVALAVHRLASRDGRTSLGVMLLAGIAFNALALAGIGFFTFIASDEQLRNLSFWNLGSLGGANWHMLALVAPCILIAALVLIRLATPLNALALGESEAGHLGVNVQGLKAVVVVLVALCVGALVAFTGTIAFIGLVAPHMARIACGPDHRLLLPACALLGSTLIVGADLVARTVVAPAELPIGIITAVLGVPFFLVLLMRQRHYWSL